MSRDQAKAIIEKLVERFQEHQKDYHLPDYNEQKTRQDFINPFFKALGWDIDNEKGDSEAYREVIYEDKLVVKGKAKAPDYGFRLSGSGKKRLFYVEAKKPSVLIKTNKESAYQLRRYGSSAGADISILTNFEDFIVYDCSKVPNLNDSATVAKLKHVGFEDYVKEFDFIFDTFSHEAVTKGRFDKFVQDKANKKGNDTLDKRFVESLDEWRNYLAKNIALNNKKINDEELNFAVQLLIDRLIFLRFCEDRAVEPENQLQKATSKGDSYKNLVDLFKQADDKYNSGLFDFKKDVITPTLKLDSKILKIVVNELYFPLCNYDFRVMPVEVLGNAYEQFLGKVIRITSARGVKIEPKPEIREAGGVFYTPQYIVDYILKTTVGKLIEGKTPKEIEKIKIVDPACGSGSFLVGAYEYLLNYHSNWYHNNLSDGIKKKGELLTPNGTLTTHEKKRILLNNIFGVDLDANAVEVSKLSLLLKCMEGETEASIERQVTMFHERVLPSLEDNLKDGNSLIGTDIYDIQFDFGFEKKIKPFSWKKSFPSIFKQGGFDVVIGNPPYVLLSADLFTKYEIEYLEKYQVAQYKVDLYHLFLERGLSLLRTEGTLGFILPSNWMTQQFTDKLRKTVLSKSKIIEIFNLDFKVFDQADVYTEIIILNNEISKPNHEIRFLSASKENFNSPVSLNARQATFLNNEGCVIDFRSLSIEGILANSIIKKSNRLDEICRASLGCQAYNSSKHTKAQIENRVFHAEKKMGKEYLEELAGSDVGRYTIERKKGQWIKYGPWLHDYRTMDWLLGPRILIREITGKAPYKIQGSYTEKTYCNYKTILNVSPSVKTKFSMKYLCGVLNSKLLSFIFSYSSNKVEANSFPRLSVGDLKKLPIKNIDFKNKSESLIHDNIVKYVDLLLTLNKEVKTEKLQTKIEQLKQRIEHGEEKINELVYGLYELTPEEIKIVEGAANE
jgi:type I restriction-modification system DNA methylase subunit